MAFTENDTANLRRKVERLKEVLANTVRYRETWQNGLKNTILEQLKTLSEAAGLTVSLEERREIENLESVVLTLGLEPSGLREPVGGEIQRDLIKQNGSLVYQQLFNGKILVLINLPYIEKYGQPQQPRTLAIYRPEELKEAYFLQHMETFVNDVSNWEDYDDETPEPNQRIGFKLNFENQK
jgi:hypothetical protein